MAATAQDPRPVEDRGMDQQVAARLDHQLDAGAAAAAVLRGRRAVGRPWRTAWPPGRPEAVHAHGAMASASTPASMTARRHPRARRGVAP